MSSVKMGHFLSQAAWPRVLQLVQYLSSCLETEHALVQWLPAHVLQTSCEYLQFLAKSSGN